MKFRKLCSVQNFHHIKLLDPSILWPKLCIHLHVHLGPGVQFSFHQVFGQFKTVKNYFQRK